MNKIYLTCCFGLDHDIVLLDQFCKYYLNLGIDKENFLLVFNTSNKGDVCKNIKQGLEILSKYEIEPKDIWCTEYESEEKWHRVNSLLEKFVKPNDWVVHPDADEFHEIYASSYKELFDIFDKIGVNAFQGLLVDRLAESLTVPETKQILNEDVFKLFPVCANLSPLLGISGVKLMGYKGNLRANNGSGQVHQNYKNNVFYSHGGNKSLHENELAIKYLGDKDFLNRKNAPCDWTKLIKENAMRSDSLFLVHHFKWHGRVIEKLNDRIQTYTKLHRPQLTQSVNVLNHYLKNGKFILA